LVEATSSNRSALIDVRIVGVAGAVCGSAICSDLVYRTLLVPRLDQWHTVPGWAWLVMFSPVVSAGLAGGAYLASPKRIVLAGMLAAASIQIVDYVAALNHLPGRLKAWAIEAPLLFWSVGTAVATSWLVAVLLIGLLARKIARSARCGGSVHQRCATSLGGGGRP
jgi:hypothetical protein